MGVCNLDTTSKEEMKLCEACYCTCQGETLLTRSDSFTSSIRTRSPESRNYILVSHDVKPIRKTTALISSNDYLTERANEVR